VLFYSSLSCLTAKKKVFSLFPFRFYHLKLFFSFFSNFFFLLAPFSAPRFTVSLDDAPEDRWTEILSIPLYQQVQKQKSKAAFISRFPPHSWLLRPWRQLKTTFPGSFVLLSKKPRPSSAQTWTII
jgi:hypothetical protein